MKTKALYFLIGFAIAYVLYKIGYTHAAIIVLGLSPLLYHVQNANKE
jgi:hypothetical protein